MPPRPQPSKPFSRYRAGAQPSLVTLPAECTLPAPDLPAGREWSDAERAHWAELWRSPQASMWDDSFVSVVALLVCYSAAILANDAHAWHASEARRLAEALGLTPTGLRHLGWQLPDQASGGSPLALLPGGAG